MGKDLKPFEFTPRLGWSATRYDTFSVCRRRYYYQYYAKHDHEFAPRDVEERKALVSVPLQIGAVVHEVIGTLLGRLRLSGAEIDQVKFFDYAERAALHSLKATTFEEVYYGNRPEISRGDLFPKVEQSLQNLLTSERLQWLSQTAIQASADWIIEPPGYGETRVGDWKAYCKVDFLFPVDGIYHIIDWKTGKREAEKHRRQLIGYAAWATYHFEIEPERVSPSIVHLHPDYHEVQETFNGFDMDSFGIQVAAETEEMYAYCRSVEENLPLDKGKFPLIDDERICSFCNFRGLCFPDRYPPVSQEP